MTIRRTTPLLLLATAIALSSMSLSSCDEDSPAQPASGNTSDRTGTAVAEWSTDKYTSLEQIYDRVPDVANCNAGQMKESERLKMLSRVNYIRKLHGLKPVTYSHADDTLTTQAALLVAANNTLNHEPPNTFKCWSQAGYDGSFRSNLSMHSDFAFNIIGSDVFLRTWLIDKPVTGLGHRRWLIDPFLKQISFGRVDRAPGNGGNGYLVGGAMRVANDELQDVSNQDIEYVAYPINIYPKHLFDKDWFLNFSVVADKANFWLNDNRGVDFASATVTVTNRDGAPMTVSSIGYDYDLYGLPNCLRWKVAGLLDNVRYTVNVANVQVNGTTKSYQYSFTIAP